MGQIMVIFAGVQKKTQNLLYAKYSCLLYTSDAADDSTEV